MTTDADFGLDMRCRFSPTMGDVTGLDLLQQDLIHRLETMRGGLIGDPDYGKSLSELLSKKTLARDLAAIPHAFEEELRKDDRVETVKATVLELTDSIIRLRFDIETGLGPFRFTVGIDRAHALVVESLKS